MRLLERPVTRSRQPVVLLVDGDEQNRHRTGQLLRTHDMEVREAADAAAALLGAVGQLVAGAP